MRLNCQQEVLYLYGFVVKTNGLIIEVSLGFVGHRPQSLILYGGSGEIRTRDQRIKRSRASSKTYISIGLAVSKNQCEAYQIG